MSAPVYGLVMAGGQSRRMGRDKALIDYHGLPQAVWTARLLRAVCDKVFLSCREGQHLDPREEGEIPVIHDLEPGLGPVGGLLSAHAADPAATWFAVGCDLPRLTADTLRFLLARRDPAKLCTAFRSPDGGLPEPLCALYEPSIMRVFQEALEDNRRCPRRILIERDTQVKLVDLPVAGALDNVNTPEDESEFRRGCP